MPKKILAIILLVTLIILQAGCSMFKETSDDSNVSPTSPPASNPTPEPEHVHSWIDATHEKPKTCKECGEIEGEPIPHDWNEANYQQPKTCRECGEIEGEPIPAKFKSLGFELSEIGVVYTYKSCYEDKSDATSNAMVKEVHVISSDDYYESKDGYEWIIANCTIEVAANPKVFQIGIERTDFYSYDLDTKFPERTVNYYGIDYEIDIKTKIIQSTSTLMEFEVGYLVPIGYDGVIFVLFNDYNNLVIDYSNPDTNVTFGDILDKDTLFFLLTE